MSSINEQMNKRIKPFGAVCFPIRNNHTFSALEREGERGREREREGEGGREREGERGREREREMVKVIMNVGQTESRSEH